VNFTFQQPGASRSGTGGARAGASRCTRPGSERGVRLAQKMRVGPRIPVGIPLETVDAGPTSRPTCPLSHLRRHRASAQALAVVGATEPYANHVCPSILHLAPVSNSTRPAIISPSHGQSGHFLAAALVH
jgi:hypothetical protein